MGKALDLTQFERSTPGPWGYEYDAEEGRHYILFGTRLRGMPGEFTEAGDAMGYVGRCRAVHSEVEYRHGCLPCEDECGECQDCLDATEAEANARLLAAAPTLLAEVRAARAQRDALLALAERWDRGSGYVAIPDPTAAHNGAMYQCAKALRTALRVTADE